MCSGGLTVEHGESLMREPDLPARQRCWLWVHLVCRRRLPVTREELADAVWGDEAPDTLFRRMRLRKRCYDRGRLASGGERLVVSRPSWRRGLSAWLSRNWRVLYSIPRARKESRVTS